MSSHTGFKEEQKKHQDQDKRPTSILEALEQPGGDEYDFTIELPRREKGYSVTLLALDHIQLAMPAGGEDEARAFYSGLLGLIEVPKPANLAKRGGVWFESGPIRVHLGVEADFHPARKAHPAFRVADLAALIVKLRAAAVAIVTDEPLPGFDRCYISDPFGNRIELLQAPSSALRAPSPTRGEGGEVAR